MKILLWTGVIVLGLGILSLFVPFPIHERQALSAGGMSIGVETAHSQILPLAASLVMMIGGLAMATTGGILVKKRG